MKGKHSIVISILRLFLPEQKTRTHPGLGERSAVNFSAIIISLLSGEETSSWTITGYYTIN